MEREPERYDARLDEKEDKFERWEGIGREGIEQR